jgi:excisionase family DNA binding protein
MSQQTESPLSADLLHGVAAIAEYLGVPERKIHWQIRQGNIPVARLGRLIVGSKSQLREHLTPKPIAARETSARETA